MNNAVNEAVNDSGNDMVLLLHGMWLNRYAMLPLARALDKAGFTPIAPSYRSMHGTLQENVDLLSGQLASLSARRIHLVGHSLGGLLALALLQRRPEDAPHRARWGRAVLLGAPIAGCASAREFARYPGGRWLLGKTVPLWSRVALSNVAGGCEVGAIAGNRRFGLAHLLVGIAGEHDGVVRVGETRLPGLSDHRVLPVSHSGMLFSAEVARQSIAFLRRGIFD